MNSSLITRAGVEFRCGLPHVPSVRLSLTVPWLILEPRCLSLGKQLRVDSGMPTTPVDYGPTEPPGRVRPAPGPRLFASHQAVAGLLRNLIPLAVPELVSGFAALFTRLQRRVDSVCPQPLLIMVQQNLLAAGLLRQVLNLSSSPGGYRITPDLVTLTAPGVLVEPVVLVTRPRRRPDYGLPGTPADCGPAEPPGLPWESQVPILCSSSSRSPFPGGRPLPDCLSGQLRGLLSRSAET